jgi:hypothetical protein
MLALLLVFSSVSSSSSPSPFNLLNNAVADTGMGVGGGSGGGGSGGGDSGGDSGNKHKPKKEDAGGDGNSIKSLSSNSGKKDDSKKDDSGKKSKDKKEDDGGNDSTERFQNKAQKNYNKAIKDIIGDINTGTLAAQEEPGVDDGNTNSDSNSVDATRNNPFLGLNFGSSSGDTTTGEQPSPPSTTPTETVVDAAHPPRLPENYESDPSYKKLGDGSITRDDNKVISPREKDISTTTWLPDKNGEWPDTITKINKKMQLDQNNDWQKYGGANEKWTPADKDGSKWIYSQQDHRLVFTRQPDDIETYEHPNGDSVTVLPDKTQIKKEPVPNAPGQFIVTTIRLDNTKIVKDPDGKETFLDADGNTQKLVFPKQDGTFDVYDPNDGTTKNTSTKPDR